MVSSQHNNNNRSTHRAIWGRLLLLLADGRVQLREPHRQGRLVIEIKVLVGLPGIDIEAPFQVVPALLAVGQRRDRHRV